MLDNKNINRLAGLSKIAFTEGERAALAGELGEIVGFLEKIKEFPPGEKADIRESAVDFENLREDAPEPSYDIDKILANASERKERFFVVPKVIE